VIGKAAMPGLAFGPVPAVELDVEAAVVCASDLIEAVTEEFKRRGEVPPSAERTLVLCRVVAGFLRTLPIPPDPATEPQAAVIAAFVAACPGWGSANDEDYDSVAALIDDVFHQREVSVPSAAAMDLLHRLTVGVMRRRKMPQSREAQLAMADWMASLYFAGNDDW